MGCMHALCIKHYDNIEMEDEHARIMKDHCAQDLAALFIRNTGTTRKNISLNMTCSVYLAYGLPMTKLIDGRVRSHCVRAQPRSRVLITKMSQ